MKHASNGDTIGKLREAWGQDRIGCVYGEIQGMIVKHPISEEGLKIANSDVGLHERPSLARMR